MASKVSVVEQARRIRAEFTDKYEAAKSPAEKAWLAGVVEGATLLYARQRSTTLGTIEGQL
jgi:hypothetical protein